MKKLLALLNTPTRAVIAVGLIILVSEYLIMVLFEIIQGTLFTKDNFQLLVIFNYLDPIVLIAIVSPALYLLIFRPMRNQQVELEQQLDELRSFQKLSIGRELRMKELVSEITALRNPLSNQSDIPVTNGSLEALRPAAKQHVTSTQQLEESQRSALLFMLKDLERSRNELELAHREWMAALDVEKDPILLHDKQFRIQRCNRAYQQRAGIPFHEIIGQPYYEIFPKSGSPLPCSLRTIEKVSGEEEEELSVDETIYRSRACSIRDEHGEYLYSMLTFEDITKQKSMAAAIIESEAHFRTLYESSRDAIMLSSPEQGFLSGNPAALILFGCRDEKEFTALSPASTSPEFQPDGRRSDVKAQEMMHLALENGSHFFEWMHQRMDGTIFPADVQLTATTIGGKSVIEAIVRDITERKRVEEALRESEEKFHKITESAQDAIIMMDSDQRISYWNTAAERIFGYLAEEAMGQELHPLITSLAVQTAFTKAFRHFIESGEGPVVGKVIEVNVLRKSGEEFPVELAISATQLKGHWHAIGIVREITERRKANIAIQHANRALATLSSVNHELVHATDENELLQVICRVIVEQSGYQMAWVGYIQNR